MRSASEELLLGLLVRDLCDRKWRVAIRHFLILRDSGVKVPALIERSCLELMRQAGMAPH